MVVTAVGLQLAKMKKWGSEAQPPRLLFLCIDVGFYLGVGSWTTVCSICIMCKSTVYIIAYVEHMAECNYPETDKTLSVSELPQRIKSKINM